MRRESAISVKDLSIFLWIVGHKYQELEEAGLRQEGNMEVHLIEVEEAYVEEGDEGEFLGGPLVVIGALIVKNNKKTCST